MSEGRILRAVGGQYEVEAPEGMYTCKARGIFRARGFPLARAILSGSLPGSTPSRSSRKSARGRTSLSVRRSRISILQYW